jgi:hypothetical protein
MKYCAPVFLMLFVLSGVYGQENTVSDSTAKDGIFERVDVEASFPGGEQGWRQHLQKNLNPLVPVDRGAPLGKFTVTVQFIVDVDGSISDIKVTSEEVGYGMEQEVLRIIKKSGAWTPAILNGRNVKAYRIQPVTFIVQDDQIEITTKTPYVLYAGVDNELKVRVSKVKGDHIQLTLTGGTVIPQGDGRFIVRIKKTGRVAIHLYNAKKDTRIGAVSFEVVNK